MLKMLGALIVVTLIAGAGWLGVQVSDRSPAATDATIEVFPKTVEQGEAILVDVKVFYRRSCQANIVRRLYDSKGEKYALPDLVLPPGATGLQHSASTIVTSPNFGIGEGRYVSSPRYSCNWFQRIFWPISVPDRYAAFQVVPRK